MQGIVLGAFTALSQFYQPYVVGLYHFHFIDDKTGSEMWSHLPKVTQLVSNGTRMETILLTIIPQEFKAGSRAYPFGE